VVDRDALCEVTPGHSSGSGASAERFATSKQAVHWSTLQLVSFLDELSPKAGGEVLGGVDGVLERAVALAGEILRAEVVAVVRGTWVLACTGFGRFPVATEALVAAANGSDTVEAAPIGTVTALAAPLSDGDDTILVVGRLPGLEFTTEDRTLAYGLARTLGLVLRSVHLVDTERMLRRRSDEQARQAQIDPLTGLANRRQLTERLAEAAAAARSGKRFAVLFLDLDGFKLVNDALGHSAGDELLQTIADRLRRTVRSDDLVARLGGDEFVLVVETVDGDDVFKFAHRVQQAVTAPVMLHSRRVTVGVSIGVKQPTGEETAEEVLRDADVAMYRSKKSCRGEIVEYRPEMGDFLLRQLELTEALHRAAERHELDVVYQPLVDSKRDRVAAVQALLRWEDRTISSLALTELIPLAEETGVLDELGPFILRRSIDDLARWRRCYPTAAAGILGMGVNVSIRQLDDSRLLEWSKSALGEFGVEPSMLVLEITEAALVSITDPDQIRCIADLRALGVRVALADFGTGHASLGHLRQHGVQALKVHRPFAFGANGDVAMLRGVLALATELRIDVVMEGVETPGELAVARAAGCRYFFGGVYAEPMPAPSFEALLAAAEAAATRLELHPIGMS